MFCEADTVYFEQFVGISALLTCFQHHSGFVLPAVVLRFTGDNPIKTHFVDTLLCVSY
jgi:hypothetical protein